MSSSVLNTIVTDCTEALARLGDLFSNDTSGQAVLSRLGWNAKTLPPPLTALAKDLQALKRDLTASLAQPESPEVWLALAEKVAGLVKDIQDLEHQGFGPGLDALGFGEKIATQLLQWTAIEQLDRRHPMLLAILRALGIARITKHPAANGRPAYIEETLVRPDFEALFTSPSTLLRVAWAWGDPAFDGLGMLQEVIAAFRALGVPAGFVLASPSPRDLAETNPGATHWHAVARFISGAAKGAAYEAGLRLVILKENGDPAIAIIPYLEGTLTEAVSFGDGFDLTIAGAASAEEGQALIISPSTIQLVSNVLGTTDSIAAAGQVSTTLRYRPTDGIEIAVGPAVVKASGWSVRGAAQANTTSDGELLMEGTLDDASLSLSFGEDGLLSSLFGSDHTSVPLPLVLGVSSKRGFYVGAAGLSIDLPVSLSFGGIEVRRIVLKLEGIDSGFRAGATFSMAATLGPAGLAIDGLGASLGVQFLDSGGNLSVADLSLDFKPPSGVGVAVDSPFVSGGGFLSFDTDKGQYAGVLQLTIQDLVTVTAIGMITTRLPHGARGFSFVIMITAQGFRPIPLGLGFTLTGLGGLLAINRTCNEEFLREGIKNKTLNDLLFPSDPIRNAPQIFGTLNNAFPPQPGSYLFGPVVQICWGTPPVVTMDLGLLLELGSRHRLIILGRVAAILPTEQEDLIRLQMNAVGIIDFDQDSISLDAVLYDSRLVGKFPITGGMALRLNWGSSPVFAISIGGFHPAFKPPPQFPALDRLAISFSNSDDFRLRCDSYMAITANTLQFGAHVDLMARAGGFSIEGHLGYDVLIQFDPFSFVADFSASVQLKFHSDNLFKVQVDGELAGPRPLHVKGKASFEIFWCDLSVSFDRTLVDGDPPPPPAPVNVMDQLIAALNQAENWSGQLPDSGRSLVTLSKSDAAGEIELHPLGKLTVKQKVVPLEVEIAKFGNTTPTDARLFNLTALSINGTATKIERVKDFFAPAQFLNLSDDEKLAAPSFEQMTAGVSTGLIGSAIPTGDDDILEDEGLTFETVIIDKALNQSRPAQPFTLSSDNLSSQLLFGSAARSDLRRAGTARYQTGVLRNVLAKKGWAVVSAEDGTSQAVPGIAAGTAVSYSESFQALQTLKQISPSRAQSLMLVRVNTN